MSSVFVVPKKPKFYKLGAKLFKWLMLCNKLTEYEKVGRVIEVQKQVGAGYKWTSVDELDCSTCEYRDSPCTLNDYIKVNGHCSNYKKEKEKN